MSNKVMAPLGLGALALVGLVLALGQPGCGSSSSSSSTFEAQCNKGCDRLGTCMPDAGASVMTCKTMCAETCSNSSARLTAVNACLAMSDCTSFEACGLTIPACASGTGTGGSGAGTGGSGAGTGGTTGSGGSGATGTGGISGGNANCSDCTKFDACCVAVGDPASSCTTAMSCNAAPAANRATLDGICLSGLQALAGTPNLPAACQ
jgi:hypothetical protein